MLPWLLAGAFLCAAWLTSMGIVRAPAGLSPAGFSVLFVTLTMAVLWVSEVLPVAATALVPLVLFPLLGIQPAAVVAKHYAASIIMLLLGGAMLAKGLERWGVPQTIAAWVQKWAQGSATRLFYGLVGVTALMSMWLSNTATTLVMVAVVSAAVQSAREREGADPAQVHRFAIAMYLGLAYAANIGGLGTPVGTAPNALLLGMLDEQGDNPFNFPLWMAAAAPVLVLMVAAVAVLLQKVLSPFDDDVLDRSPGTVRPVGLSTPGKRAALIFGLTAVLWLWRKDIDLGAVVVPGWTSLLGLEGIDDGTVAMMGVVAMFVVRAGPGRGGVLDWPTANQVPWGLFLLFGGGLAVAAGFGTTGLSVWLGEQVQGLAGWPVGLVVLIIALCMSLLTEVTSNTATTTLLLPVLLAAAKAIDLDPLMLMWPAAICASAAFILPISTPPNAIVAGAGDISMKEMARVGVWLNLIAVGLVTVVTMVWLPWVLGR